MPSSRVLVLVAYSLRVLVHKIVCGARAALVGVFSSCDSCRQYRWRSQPQTPQGGVFGLPRMHGVVRLWSVSLG